MKVKPRKDPNGVRAESHPYVSEAHEGKPPFEWGVAACVLVSAVLAAFGHLLAATLLISAASIVCATVRLVLRERSPWKIRSVGFDSFFGFALGIGLMASWAAIVLL
ncbi:DUF3017 domain-containing protein [Bifidobacterium callimiconis]|uniref:Rod shape-determining protein RodA n=1 Tax=Bifidobacterium callimiconis TaxID=2306973 RepID=A0A430FHR9_9BIFI|nr:DUF3017 domain-containing protein [Bifidobacterium callimiconis]MBT1177950.1 DUF3017 domain-containing protein [Bifidobacterium callimiconis]RSX52312.1 rod shape-determining protein RodA [Bifidobacterium callimiconis]